LGRYQKERIRKGGDLVCLMSDNVQVGTFHK